MKNYDIEIQLIKNGLMILGMRIENAIDSAKTDEVREDRKQSLNVIYSTLELISDLQMSLVRSSIKESKLTAYIEATSKTKFEKKC